MEITAFGMATASSEGGATPVYLEPFRRIRIVKLTALVLTGRFLTCEASVALSLVRFPEGRTANLVCGHSNQK